MLIILALLFLCIAIGVIFAIMEQKYRQLEETVLREMGLPGWDIISYYDEYIVVKSRQALEKYDDVKFFKENREELARAKKVIKRKNEKK